MPKIEKDLLKVKGSDGQWHYIPAVGGGDTPTWDAVQNKPFSTLGDGLEVDENGVLSAKGGTGGSPNAVQYVAQSLTDEQKTQARENIGAGTSSFSGSYNDLTNKPAIPTQVTIDSTLKQSGYAADAKAVGDALAEKADTTDIPNVPDWALADEKPTYTAEEVGALPDTTVIPPAYTLPQATADALGGIKADAATDEDTQDVRIGTDGKLKTKSYELTDADKTAVAEKVVEDGIAAMLVDMPSGGGGAWELIGEANLTEDVASCSFDVENYEHYEVVVALVNSSSNPGNRALEVRLNAQQGKVSTASSSIIAASGTRSVWATLIRQNGVWYATARNNLNGAGIIDGIVENMASIQTAAWTATELTTKVTVSNFNQLNSYFLGAGTKVKVYGVK